MKRVVRAPGMNVGSPGFLNGIRRTGHAYRGMTEQEFRATVGSGRGVQSRGDYSLRGEGTNYASDPSTAESYVNYGRDDPRRAGRATYLVEVRADGLGRSQDGYLKASGSLPVTRAWKMEAHRGAITARPIRKGISRAGGGGEVQVRSYTRSKPR